MRRDMIVNEIQTILNDLNQSGMAAMFEKGMENVQNRNAPQEKKPGRILV